MIQSNSHYSSFEMEKVIGTNVKCLMKYPDGTYKQIAFARKANISMRRDMIEVASSTSGVCKEFLPMRIQWSASIEGLLSDEQEKLYSMFFAGEALDISWNGGISYAYYKFAFKGKAYIKSLVLTGNIHEMATFNAELQGTGTLSCTDFPFEIDEGW